MKAYALVFEAALNNFAAYVPDLPGCVSTGKTREESSATFGKRSRFRSKGCG
jgi:predicted RNase H-like HicB family nuclease